MKKQYHILNGDALKEQLPPSIEGEIIVARECLVDGSVKGKSLDELYETRARFLASAYGLSSKAEYYEKGVVEFEKIIGITDDADINLWFEDDLFCQINFWFTANLLYQSDQQNPIYLIRPKEHSRYGFGGLNGEELQDAFENRILITELDEIAGLWMLYQQNELEQLRKTAVALKPKYPFIIPAVMAHLDRIPTEGNPGRPIQAIIQIMNEFQTEDFGKIFQEFCARESIYGFGDLQVKRLVDQIKSTDER